MSEENIQWVKDLYKQTNDLWIRNGKDPLGYAIFYTPVFINPDLLIIGFNPGGDENSFNEANSPPTKHDYFTSSYPLGEQMKQLFQNAGIIDKLENSVKFNLYPFRSKKSKEIRSLPAEIKKISLNHAKIIIEKLQPKVILTEGFETFEVLTSILNIQQESQETEGGKAIFIKSMYKTIPIIGILHPTGARGVTNEIWQKTSGLLKEHLAN